MPVILKNNAFGFLQSAISNSDTSLVLQSGYGANFPSLGAGDYFYTTISPTSGASEIVKCTARSGDSLTVVRAQEGTSALAFSAGSRIELRVTAQSVVDAIADRVALKDQASEISFVPYGNIAATNVQAAVQEEIDDLAAPGGSVLVGYLPNGTNAVTRTVQSKLRETISVLDFMSAAEKADVTSGSAPTLNVTSAIQAAIDAAWVNHALLIFPTGNYLVTDTLDVYEGTQIQGETKFQYTKGYSRPPKATSIFFQPTVGSTDLFSYSWKSASPPGFIFHAAIEGIYFETNTSNARYGINLNGVIYGNFSNMGFEGPWTASIYCYGTINNRFENIYARGNTAAVVYAGNNETTDVWDQCSFWGSPIGAQLNGSVIGVRFTSCLWEQITTYGMDIHSKCQAITVTDGYCEDVPFGASPAADSCMFRVGLISGSSLTDINNHLIVTGGMFNGRSAGAAGQLFKVGICWGIIVTGIVANRWPLLFETDPTNTQSNSILVSGMQGISWSALIDDVTKWSGVVPGGVVNSSPFNVNFRGSGASLSTTSTTTLTNSQVVPGSAWYPNTDGVAFLGLSNQRWDTLYAINPTINTSDANEKQDIVEISDAEKRVALRIKGMFKRYRFKDAFSQKGDGARYHFGAIAQEVAQAFEDEGLDASRYGLFCSDTWYTVDGKWVKEVTADKKYVEKKYFAGDVEMTFEDGAQISENVQVVETLHDTEEHTRLGLRYGELLSFVLASI